MCDQDYKIIIINIIVNALLEKVVQYAKSNGQMQQTEIIRNNETKMLKIVYMAKETGNAFDVCICILNAVKEWFGELEDKSK